MKNKRSVIYIIVGVTITAMLLFALVLFKGSSEQEKEARSVIEAYFKYLAARDVVALFAICEPPPEKRAEWALESASKRFASPDAKIQGDIRSLEIIDSRLEGDLFAALVGWKQALGYRQVDLIYVKRNEQGEWKMPLWLPYPLRPEPWLLGQATGYQIAVPMWSHRTTSFHMEGLLEAEPEKVAVKVLLKWGRSGRDRLNKEYFREDMIEAAAKLTEDRSSKKQNRSPKEVVEEYFNATKSKRGAEFLSLLARPQDGFESLGLEALKNLVTTASFRGPIYSDHRVTDKSKRSDSVAVVICELKPTDRSGIEDEFSVTVIKQEGEWRILQNFNLYGLGFQTEGSDRTEITVGLSEEQLEEIEELASWSNAQIVEKRKKASKLKWVANEKSRAEQEEKLAKLIQQGRELAKARVAAGGEARSPSEVMKEYLDYCEKNEPAKVISLHHWNDANQEASRFRTVTLSHPLLVIPDSMRKIPEIEFSKLRIVGEENRGNFSVVVVERPSGKSNATEREYFSSVYFAKQDGEWRVLVSQIHYQTLDSENLITIHGLPPADAGQFKEMQLWGRRTGHKVRQANDERREKVKIEESIGIIADAWERIEERKANSTMAKTPTEAFEEFWKAYKAGDWSTAASYVTLEVFLSQAVRERDTFSEESLRQSDLANRVREVFERTEKEEKDAKMRAVVRGIEAACAGLDREVRDADQAVIRPEVKVAWSDTSGEAGHLILAVTRKYSKATTTYYSPVALLKLSGEWRFISLPPMSSFGTIPKSYRDDRGISWKKTEAQMEILDPR